MFKNQLIKIIYWVLASLLIAFLIQNSIPLFWHAWLIALFLLPLAFVVKMGIEKIKHFKGIKKWLRSFLLAVISLYWGYIAIAIAYWYFLELKSDTLEGILINPIFIWIIIGFFVLLEYVLFKKTSEERAKSVSIYSERKKTVLEIHKIAYIESRDNYTMAILKDGSQYKNAIKISEWEFKLNDFLRIHRSFLVNPEWSIIKGNDIIVNGEIVLPISRSYKKKIEAYYQNI